MLYGDDPLKLNNYNYSPSLVAIIQSGNLYVYAMNNPVKYSDPDVEIVHIAVGAGIGAGVSFITNIVKQAANILSNKQNNFNSKELIIVTAGGAVSGALSVSGVGMVATILGSAAISASADIVDQAQKADWDYSAVKLDDVLVSAVAGAGGALIPVKAANTSHIASIGNKAFDRIVYATSKTDVDKALSYYVSQTKKDTQLLKNAFRISSIPSVGKDIYNIVKG